MNGTGDFPAMVNQVAAMEVGLGLLLLVMLYLAFKATKFVFKMILLLAALALLAGFLFR
jgi:hypothetical protein